MVEKTFYLEAIPQTAQGSGFRQPLRTAMRLHPATGTEGLPLYEDIIREKYHFALSRFRDREVDAGFEMFPDYAKGTQYVMGWCGQADAAGYSMLALADKIGDPKMVSYGERSLNLLSQSPFNKNVFRLRGGYSESWTVFWITAHFLNAASEFERMGVDLDEAEGAIARSKGGAGR